MNTTIARVEVENFRRIRVAHVEFVPEKGLVRVTGPNAAGKTTLLKAIAGNLGGAGQVHEGSLRDGEEKGKTTIVLTNGYRIERTMTEANPKGYLSIRSPDGGKYTQGKLNSWLGVGSFDPMAFLSLAPDRQRDILFSLSKNSDLPRDLLEIRNAHEARYAERTPLIARERYLKAATMPEGDRPVPVDTSAEVARLRELRQHESQIAEARHNARASSRLAEQAREDAADACWRVLEMEVALKEAKLDADRATAQAADLSEAAGVLEKEVEGLADPTQEIAEVEVRIEDADSVLSSLEPWHEWDRAQKELIETVRKRKAFDAVIKTLDVGKAKLLADAQIPVDGLGFDDEGVPLIHGQPIGLASGREKADFVVDVAFAADPEIRVCLLDEANDYDLESLERLDERAKEEHFQVWAVRLGLEGPGEIVVEDGLAQNHGAHLCVVCHRVPVAVEEGFDTCESCLAHI